MGCALFYFISGYLCQQGRKDRFDLWMKRKLSRLWPICMVTAFIGGFFGHGCSVAFALSGSGWFVTLLLVYYVLYYVVVRIFPRHLGVISIASLVLTFLAYALGFWSQDVSCGAWLFGVTNLKYIYFFAFFMLGAWVSQRKDSPDTVRWGSVALLFISLASFYLLYFLAGRVSLVCKYQVVMLLPLMSTIYYLHRVCSSKRFYRLMENKYVSTIVLFVGGLSLEMYLIGWRAKMFMFTEYFPLCYICGFVVSLALLYLARCVARFVGQTFCEGAYDYIAIFRPFKF